MNSYKHSKTKNLLCVYGGVFSSLNLTLLFNKIFYKHSKTKNLLCVYGGVFSSLNLNLFSNKDLLQA
jgi:hypothetical protein